MENLLKWRDSTGSMNIGANIEDEKYAILFVELSLKLSEVDDNGYIFLSIRLVSFFYNYIQRT